MAGRRHTHRSVVVALLLLVPLLVAQVAAYKRLRLGGGASGKLAEVTSNGALLMALSGSAAQAASDPGVLTFERFRLAGGATGNLAEVDSTGHLLVSCPTCSSGVAIGDTITSGTAGSLLYLGPAGVLAQDNANLFWDATNQVQYLGNQTTASSPLSPNPSHYRSILTGATGHNGALALVNAWPEIPTEPSLDFYTSNGTAAVPTALTGTEEIGVLNFYGYNGAGGSDSARIVVTATGAATNTSSAVPASLGFWTAPSGASSDWLERLRLTAVGTAVMATPNASSTVVMAGQVEVQQNLYWPLTIAKNPALTFTPDDFNPTVTMLNDGGTSQAISMVSAKTGATTNFLAFFESRGSVTTPTAITANSVPGEVDWYGHDGTAYVKGAMVQGVFEGTIGTGRTPMRLDFYTLPDTGSPSLTKALSLDAAQGVTMSGLASTGAASGKTIVCADTNGKLYRSSSGVACAN